MAMTSTFTTGWKLSGGFMDTIQLKHPMGVYDALADHGFAHSAPTGMQLVNDAWIWLTHWRYEYTFAAPEEDDERYELSFEHLSGSGDIALNGQSIASFESGGLRLDITSCIQQKNTLTLHFHPVLPNRLADEHSVGILGAVRLRTTNYVTLHDTRFEPVHKAGGMGIQTNISYTAHCAGRYTFRYILSREGLHIAQYDFPESLRAAKGDITHTLVADRIPLNSENFVVDIRLSIERAGIGCDLVRSQVVFGRARKAVDYAGNAEEFLYGNTSESNEKRMTFAKILGLERVCLPGDNPRIPAPSLLEPSIDISPLEARCADIAYPAPVQGDTVASLAGSEISWPPSTPLWRLMGGDFADHLTLEALYGSEIFSDMALFTRILRARQAEAVCQLAHHAHKAGQTAYIPMLMERYPRLASNALIEYGGKPRPAFLALRNLMGGPHAYVEVPGDGRIATGSLVKLPVWFDGNIENQAPLSISVACYDLGGHVVGGTSFTAYADKTVRLGDVTIEVPHKPCVLILRTLTAGFERSNSITHDQILVAGGDGAPLSPLLHLPETSVREEAGRLVNNGSYAALSLAVYGDVFAYYGALLPGDHIAVSVKHPVRVESLNGKHTPGTVS